MFCWGSSCQLLMQKVSVQQQATEATCSSLPALGISFATLPSTQSGTHTRKVLARWEDLPFAFAGLGGPSHPPPPHTPEGSAAGANGLAFISPLLRYRQLKVLKLYICCVKCLNTLLPRRSLEESQDFLSRKHHINILVYLRLNISPSFRCTFYCSSSQCT